MVMPLQVLVLEDSEADYELMLRELRRGGYEPESVRVHTAADMKAALESKEWDVILSDFAMPQFDAFEAMKVLDESGLDTPFIVVSGTIGEDVAVEAMKAGAHDYMMKDNLKRLLPAVKRELQDAEVRNERRRILGEHERLLHDMQERVKELTCLYRISTLIIDPDKSPEEIFEQAVHMISPGWQCPEITCARISFEGVEYTSDRFRESQWKLSADITVSGKKHGSIEVFYLDEVSELDKGPFLKEERALIDNLAGQLGGMIKSKRAEEALRQSEERYRRLVELAREGIWVIDEHNKTTFVNPRMAEMLGYSMEEMMGASLFSFMDERGVDLCNHLLERRMQGVSEDHDFEFITKQGKRVYAYVATNPLIDDNGKYQGALAVVTDVTERHRREEERKQLEEQLHQAVKMEAIGRLAGGVAHDFNNALTPMLGISEMLLKDLDPTHPMYRDINEILSAGKRCADLTRQLLAFGRRQPVEIKVISLNDVVTGMENMLSRVIGEDIGLVKYLDPELGSVDADPGQMEQIIANLAVNARDAMPGGGKLTIETRNVHLDREYANNHVSVVPGPYVMLAVSDTGQGMDEQTMMRIFEPFYTTKKDGKGTGLGLASVYAIAKNSRGNVWVYSEPGKGSTFKVYLPRVEKVAEEVKEPGRVSAEPLRGSETVLLVEDNDSVREVARRILVRQGYRVLEAGSGEEAVEVCEKTRQSIHLMITDVVMPGMSGKELAQTLSASFPEMKVLYTSGYTDNAIVHHGVLEEGTHFIQKPFTIESLTRKVREVLEGE